MNRPSAAVDFFEADALRPALAAGLTESKRRQHRWHVPQETLRLLLAATGSKNRGRFTFRLIGPGAYLMAAGTIHDHQDFAGARNGTVTSGSPIAKNAAQTCGGSPAFTAPNFAALKASVTGSPFARPS
jgi:hypothetical protein